MWKHIFFKSGLKINVCKTIKFPKEMLMEAPREDH